MKLTRQERIQTTTQVEDLPHSVLTKAQILSHKHRLGQSEGQFPEQEQGRRPGSEPSTTHTGQVPLHKHLI